MKALLIADSPDYDSAYIAGHAATMDMIIVTDGALDKLPPSVTPTIVCGDFDGLVLSEARAKYVESEFVTLDDQKQNDLEKALELAFSRGASEITIASAFGGRMDISVANLSVLVRHHTRCALSMIHGSMISRVLSDRVRGRDEVRFDARADLPLSCIALDGDAVVTLTNVRWPLTEEVLQAGSHGVGNRALGGPVCIKVHRGLIIVGYEIPAG